MRFKRFFVLFFFIVIFPSFVFAQEPAQRIDGIKIFPSIKRGNFENVDNPLQGDNIFYVDKWNPPYARAITNVIVGSYYFPVIIFETGSAWNYQSIFCYWDDLYQIWSYPDSFTSSGGNDTGWPSVCSDSKGNLHFAWHQGGNPDGYEIFYTRALLDTSAGIIQYNVERPASMISATDGEEDLFPSMNIYNDIPCVVWNHGSLGSEHAIYYCYDGNWGVAYEHGTPFPASWLFTTVAPDLNTGDMWVALAFDSTGDNSIDMLALHYDYSSLIWSVELVAAAPSMHPYCLPGIAVDASGNPHIIFQENLTNTGGIGGLSGWGECGPAGTILYSGRIGGSWSSPIPLYFPRYEPCNYATGIPSVGITDYCVYFSVTQPESATPDTSAYLPFNVYYACYNPYLDTLCFGDKVNDDTLNCFYPHITYFVPYTIEPSGPGIAWAEGPDVNSPDRVIYKQMPLLCPGSGVKETEIHGFRELPLSCYPNPFSTSTHISLTLPSIGQSAGGIGQSAEGNSSAQEHRCTGAQVEAVELRIYDLSGRLVKNLSLGTVHSALGTEVTWDGRDNTGVRVRSGVYFVSLKAGEKMLTKKLILVE